MDGDIILDLENCVAGGKQNALDLIFPLLLDLYKHYNGRTIS